MKAIIQHNGAFTLCEGEAKYFVKKEDFLRFLSEPQNLKSFLELADTSECSISPLETQGILSQEAKVRCENQHERLGFYEYFGT